MELSVAEITTLVCMFVGVIAAYARLDYNNRQNSKDLAAHAEAFNEALKMSDNRMNKIQDTTDATLKGIFVELRAVSQSVNDKFTSTSNAVAKLEGILLERNK